MPPTVEIKDARYTVEITCAAPIPFRGDYLTAMYDELDAWHAALPMASFVWEVALPEGDLALYTMTATAVDGRKWELTVGIRPGVAEPVYSFNVPDRFAESEFEPQRRLRSTVVAITKAYSVSKIEVVWT